MSIAAVHEQLDQADGADSVEMRSYLTGLVNLLQARLAGPLGGRSIELSAEAGARWSPQRAKAIGLVLGELLADAMSRDADGLRIRFQEGPDGPQMALEDSRGDRPLSDAEGEGIGLGLVAVLLKEQGAEVSVVRHEGGSRVVVAFPPCVGAG
jgi:two-component sensor histidine kinase